MEHISYFYASMSILLSFTQAVYSKYPWNVPKPEANVFRRSEKLAFQWKWQKMKQQKAIVLKKRAAPDFDDPGWDDQFYLKEGTNTTIGQNVQAVWYKGFTGKDILIGVIDDGLKYTHDEFKNRYIAEASYDFIDNDSYPNPSSEGHGTNCAGVIAGEANNDVCGVGVAYEANIAAIRLIEIKEATDENEAKVFNSSRVPGHGIDIFSNSWGPRDNGYEIRGPKIKAQNALKKGVEEGRNGLGSIYVFAAGNGGFLGDSCAFNGYVNSIYTIAVGGVLKNGDVLRSTTPCAAVMTAACAEDLVTASSSNDKACTKFGHTSAATAVVSGIIALALQANKKLTWRDIQHLIVRSSNASVIKDDRAKWIVNKAGFKVSEKVGFGLIDAKTFVENAQKWTNALPEQIKCEITISSPRALSAENDIATVYVNVDDHVCNGGIIKSLEHVQLKVNLEYERRGLIAADLTSPKQTTSRMLHPRAIDVITRAKNYTDWTTTSVQFWGEPSDGLWTVTFKNGLPLRGKGTGTLFSMSLIFYGMKVNPGNKPDDDKIEETESTKESTKHPSTRTTMQNATATGKSSFNIILHVVTPTSVGAFVFVGVIVVKIYYSNLRNLRSKQAGRSTEPGISDQACGVNV